MLTVTAGRDELEQCVRSIDEQTYPVFHHIVTDAIVSFADYVALAKEYNSYNRAVSYWNGKIGGYGLEGRRLFAACPSLVNEDVLFMLPDDDWFLPNHVESLIKIIEEGNDWAYSLMKVYDKDGKFLFDDKCECLGEEHPAWNTGQTFAPTGSVACKIEVARNLANIYNTREWGPDRMWYNAAKQFYPKFKGSKQHTMCFRLGGNETSSNRAFFEQGNKFMQDTYGDVMPWEQK